MRDIELHPHGSEHPDTPGRLTGALDRHANFVRWPGYFRRLFEERADNQGAVSVSPVRPPRPLPARDDCLVGCWKPHHRCGDF